MTRQELINYIFDEYSVEPDFPFRMDDVTCVFRHIDNRKWFGIAMVIPYKTIGLNKAGNVDILNVGILPCIPYEQGQVDHNSAGWFSGAGGYQSAAGHELRNDGQ